jgi:hypothetical protein
MTVFKLAAVSKAYWYPNTKLQMDFKHQCRLCAQWGTYKDSKTMLFSGHDVDIFLLGADMNSIWTFSRLQFWMIRMKMV